MRIVIILIIILTSFSYSIELTRNVDNRFVTKLELLNNVEKSKQLITISSPVKPMLASLAIPGLGQYLNHSPWWKTALFAGVEIAGIAGYVIWSNKADDITLEYENWADVHWDMHRWVGESTILLSEINANGYPDVNDVIIDGSHHITITVDGKYESSRILVDNPNIDYIELRDWDFYEGIGKYDQFVAGWDDARSDWEIIDKNIENGNDELIVMTPNKQHYLNLRNDSNILYENAKFAASILLFNHLFSALEALWNANNSKELSYGLDVSIGTESRYVVKGLTIKWNL